MAGRGAGGGAQRGQERGGRHEPAAGAGASTDPDRCAPPPCDGPSGCAVPPAGSARARALARNFGRLALRDRAGRPGPAPRRLKRQLGERIFWRRSRPRRAPGAAAGGSGETARVGVARKRARRVGPEKGPKAPPACARGALARRHGPRARSGALCRAAGRAVCGARGSRVWGCVMTLAAHASWVRFSGFQAPRGRDLGDRPSRSAQASMTTSQIPGRSAACGPYSCLCPCAWANISSLRDRYLEDSGETAHGWCANVDPHDTGCVLVCPFSLRLFITTYAQLLNVLLGLIPCKLGQNVREHPGFDRNDPCSIPWHAPSFFEISFCITCCCSCPKSPETYDSCEKSRAHTEQTGSVLLTQV